MHEIEVPDVVDRPATLQPVAALAWPGRGGAGAGRQAQNDHQADRYDSPGHARLCTTATTSRSEAIAAFFKPAALVAEAAGFKL